MAIFLNVSCLWWHQRERTHTLLVALFVIRGYLGFLRPSRSVFTLWCLLRGWSISVLQYFVKNWTWVIVFEGRPFILWERYMAKIYERLLAWNIRQGKSWDWFDPRGQNLSGEDSNCLVEHLQIAWMMDCFIFFFLFLKSLGCFRRWLVFCQGSMKVKLSPLSVLC